MRYPESPKVTTQGVILEEGGYKKKKCKKWLWWPSGSKTQVRILLRETIYRNQTCCYPATVHSRSQ